MTPGYARPLDAGKKERLDAKATKDSSTPGPPGTELLDTAPAERADKKAKRIHLSQSSRGV